MENLHYRLSTGLQVFSQQILHVNKLYHVVLCSFLLHPVVSRVFHSPDIFRVQVFESPGFCESRFFRVQVFLSPGFSGFRFFRVRVQGLAPCFRSNRLCFLVLTVDFCYSQLIFFCDLFKKDTKINR